MSKVITDNDLKGVLNKVLPTAKYGAIYSASWSAASSAANNTALTNSVTIPAGTYVLICYSPIASVDFSIGVAGHYKEMNKNGDSFALIYSCNETVTFYAQSAQSASVTFSYTERGGLYAIQISDANYGTNEADYIIEQGISGIWTYRKWNSGIIELWGTYSENLTYTANANASGGYRAGTTSISLPFTLTNIISAVATPNGTSSNYYSVVSNINITTTSVSLSLDRGGAATGTTSVGIEIKGRWK